jgi:uncharacterized repeat protein (TIGR03803 family)
MHLRGERGPSMNGNAFRVMVFFAVHLLALGALAAPQYRVVHPFHYHPAGYPCSNLIADSAGNLYGTTCDDVVHRAGVVYELSPSSSGGWIYHILHAFTVADGQFPQGKLLLDANGNLYGTTYQGGHNYNGVVYELIPNGGGRWKEKILHYFNFNDGAGSMGGLAMDAEGNLYGATHNGGTYDEGVAYMLSPGANGKWVETVLHDFSGSEGVGVQTGVLFDGKGNLYGATESEVFVLTRNSRGGWTESVAYTFNPATDGWNIYGDLIFDDKGNLYGCNSAGGVDGRGTVFRLSQNSQGNWMSTVLTDFSGGRYGYDPYSGLALDSNGDVFGTTSFGGLNNNGVLFKLRPASGGKWSRALLHSFTGGRDGGAPGGVILNASSILGYATEGGQHECFDDSGCGVVFEFTP